ncbi:hypothetical protein VTL71DRAFT_2870 [Oculimacula yallundae]|uniref:Major facilitator superfamily (MFS) profile domain-containing protein n=1 Tax=Oculimacula yallundae TaxID=86028 RepID=A0ABR4C5J6_9HELO
MVAANDPTDIQHENHSSEINSENQTPANNDEKNIKQETETPPRDPELAVSTSDEVEHSTSYEYATPKELSLLSTAFTIATFMIAIDGSILSTAIPRITTDFHHIEDISWYGSAYLLTEMAFQPTFGRLYTLFEAKPLYLISIIIFEAGSILCAASPNSASLIIGRAISGAGAAGLLCGSLTIFGRSVPLKKRPFGMALITSMYGIAGVIGPTLGGVITDTPRLTWRFCFWMNLPAGAVTFFIAYRTFKQRTPVHGKLSVWEKLKKLDFLGAVLLTGGLVALFIALQWGGSRYTWSNPKVLGSVITFGVLTIAFGALQAFKKEEQVLRLPATMPMRILTQRTVAISCIFNILISMAQNTHNYYLSFYFQAVLGTNAAISGVRSLAYGVPCSAAILLTGFSISSKGYYVPFIWLGMSIFLTGCILLHTLSPSSAAAQWASYQVIAGFGLGLAEQVPFIAVQVVLPDDDMPLAFAMVVFSRCLGGAVGLSVAGNVFSAALLPKLARIHGLDVSATTKAGLSDLAAVVPSALLGAVRGAFNGAIVKSFVMPIAVASIALALSLGFERRRIPDEPDPRNDGHGVETAGVSLQRVEGLERSG